MLRIALLKKRHCITQAALTPNDQLKKPLWRKKSENPSTYRKRLNTPQAEPNSSPKPSKNEQWNSTTTSQASSSCPSTTYDPNRSWESQTTSSLCWTRKYSNPPRQHPDRKTTANRFPALAKNHPPRTTRLSSTSKTSWALFILLAAELRLNPELHHQHQMELLKHYGLSHIPKHPWEHPREENPLVDRLFVINAAEFELQYLWASFQFLTFPESVFLTQNTVKLNRLVMLGLQIFLSIILIIWIDYFFEQRIVALWRSDNY